MVISGLTQQQSNPKALQAAGSSPATRASNDRYIPPDITGIHKATTENTSQVTSNNMGMRVFTGAFRVATGVAAALGAAATAVTLFLFNAKIALLCAIPTLAALAGFIALKPKEAIHTQLQNENLNLINSSSSDAELAKPEHILSRPKQMISALKNARDTWRGLDEAAKINLQESLENLQGKIMPIQERYQELINTSPKGSNPNLSSCSLAQLNEMLDIIKETLSELAIRNQARKEVPKTE